MVGGHGYRIHSNKESVIRLDAASSVGQCYSGAQRMIHISPDLVQPDKTRVILHEVFHAIDDIYNQGKWDEEVDKMAQGLLQVTEQLGIRLEV